MLSKSHAENAVQSLTATGLRWFMTKGIVPWEGLHIGKINGARRINCIICVKVDEEQEGREKSSEFTHPVFCATCVLMSQLQFVL